MSVERLTVDQLRGLQSKKKVGRIRGTKRADVNGITFDSTREAKRYAELCLLVRAGQIADLERQVKVPLLGSLGPILTPTGKHMTYVADFVYRDMRSGATVYEDAKGFPTDTYRMKKAVLAAMGIEVREI